MVIFLEPFAYCGVFRETRTNGLGMAKSNSRTYSSGRWLALNMPFHLLESTGNFPYLIDSVTTHELSRTFLNARTKTAVATSDITARAAGCQAPPPLHRRALCPSKASKRAATIFPSFPGKNLA